MTQLTDNIFAVEAPEGARNIKLFRNRIHYQDVGGDSIDLRPGNWQLLCTTMEATEEQLKALAVLEHHNFSEWYINFIGRSSYFTNRKSSLRSLLTSKGLDGSKNYVLLKRVP